MAVRSTNLPRPRSATSRTSGTPRTAKRSTAVHPVEALISWDANGFDDTPFCGEDTYGLVNAAFCYDDDTIGWDRGELLPALRKAYGDMGVTMVLAHEYGHAVQHQAGLNNKNTPTLVSEQQADCFAGGYMRWVAEDKSPRFTLSTGDGLNNVLAAVIAFRDPLWRRVSRSRRRRTRLGVRAAVGVPVRLHRRAIGVCGNRHA
jgi:Predicted metalloprotease